MKFHHFRPILVSEPCRNIQKNSAFDCNENFVLPTLFVQSHLQCNNNDASIAGCHEQCAEFLPKFPIKVSLRSPLKSPHESARTLAAKRCRYMIICWYIYCKKLKIWRWVKSQNLLCFIPGQKRLWSKSCKGKGIFKINFATS